MNLPAVPDKPRRDLEPWRPLPRPYTGPPLGEARLRRNGPQADTQPPARRSSGRGLRRPSAPRDAWGVAVCLVTLALLLGVWFDGVTAYDPFRRPPAAAETQQAVVR